MRRSIVLPDGPDFPPLVVEDVAFHHDRVAEAVFDGVSFTPEAGRVVALLGNNGAGKSTLLDVIAGIKQPTRGRVMLFGKDLREHTRKEIAQHVAYVTQHQRVPHHLVYDQVLLGRKPHIGWNVTAHDHEVVERTLVDLGLASFATRYMDELSGGERQKVVIARALAQEPAVLLLDEPTSALDLHNQYEVLDLLAELTRNRGLATLMVMHDVNLALRFADDFALLSRGRIASYGSASETACEALSEMYGLDICRVESDGLTFFVPDVRR